MKKYFLVLLIAAFTLSACQQQKTLKTNKVSPIVKESAEKSLKEILAENKSQRCLYAFQEDGYEVMGSLVLKGNKFRQEAKIPAKVSTIDVFTIGDGDYLYIWGSSMSGNGIKMRREELNGETLKRAQEQGVDLDKKMKYDCNEDQVDDKEFELPANIKFADMTEFLNKIKSSKQ